VTLDPDGLDVMGPGWAEHRESRRVHRERWEVRAAEWTVLELARHVFGEGASVRLARYPARGPFRGLLSVEVPFQGLDDHREREERFLSLVRGDAILDRVPLVFVFDPFPADRPLPSLERAFAAPPGPASRAEAAMSDAPPPTPDSGS
jgi:hypothetical protein